MRFPPKPPKSTWRSGDHAYTEFWSSFWYVDDISKIWVNRVCLLCISRLQVVLLEVRKPLPSEDEITIDMFSSEGSPKIDIKACLWIQVSVSFMCSVCPSVRATAQIKRTTYFSRLGLSACAKAGNEAPGNKFNIKQRHSDIGIFLFETPLCLLSYRVQTRQQWHVLRTVLHLFTLNYLSSHFNAFERLERHRPH